MCHILYDGENELQLINMKVEFRPFRIQQLICFMCMMNHQLLISGKISSKWQNVMNIGP